MKHSRLTRRDLLRSACVGALAAAAPIRGQAASTNERPNIVVVLTDDQGRVQSRGGPDLLGENGSTEEGRQAAGVPQHAPRRRNKNPKPKGPPPRGHEVLPPGVTRR